MHRIASSILAAALLPLAALPSHAQDAGADPIPTVQQLSQWQQCREYLPNHPANTRGCRVDFDMTQTKDGKNPPQTHKDITVHLGTDMRGVVVLWHSSPFAACSLSTQSGPLARDSSANISAALTSAGGLGAFPQAQGQMQLSANFGSAGNPITAAEIAESGDTLDQHVDEKTKQLAQGDRGKKAKAIQELEDGINQALLDLKEATRVYDNLQSALQDIAVIRKNLLYSYADPEQPHADDANARLAIKNIDEAAVRVVGRPLPDNKTTIANLQKSSDAIATKIAQLKKAYPNEPKVLDFAKEAQKQVDSANQFIQGEQAPEVVAQVAYVTDAQAAVQKIMDFERDWIASNPPTTDASVQILPIALYSESKVGVTVKCTDVVTKNPLFDNIQFNAYFQRPPVFDISSGVLISTLHGRQATTQAPYSAPSSATSCPATAATSTTPATTSDCPLVAINETRPQFMPGVFAEWHPFNFKLPWVHDPARVAANPPATIPTWMSQKAPRHALGYVGSVGFAGGFMVNPNNGTTTAEFFEGLSFGIERFVILIGNHNGRSQNLTDGYSIGAPVAAGTTPTTVSNWANALAFGITYRVPLR